MTGPEWQDYLVRLSLEAFDKTFCEDVDRAFLEDDREAFQAAMRERMAQAAQTIALEVDERWTPTVVAVVNRAHASLVRAEAAEVAVAKIRQAWAECGTSPGGHVTGLRALGVAIEGGPRSPNEVP